MWFKGRASAVFRRASLLYRWPGAPRAIPNVKSHGIETEECGTPPGALPSYNRTRSEKAATGNVAAPLLVKHVHRARICRRVVELIAVNTGCAAVFPESAHGQRIPIRIQRHRKAKPVPRSGVTSFELSVVVPCPKVEDENVSVPPTVPVSS